VLSYVSYIRKLCATLVSYGLLATQVSWKLTWILKFDIVFTIVHMVKALEEKSDIDVLFIAASICQMKLMCKHEVEKRIFTQTSFNWNILSHKQFWNT